MVTTPRPSRPRSLGGCSTTGATAETSWPSDATVGATQRRDRTARHRADAPVKSVQGPDEYRQGRVVRGCLERRRITIARCRDPSGLLQHRIAERGLARRVEPRTDMVDELDGGRIHQQRRRTHREPHRDRRGFRRGDVDRCRTASQQALRMLGRCLGALRPHAIACVRDERARDRTHGCLPAMLVRGHRSIVELGASPASSNRRVNACPCGDPSSRGSAGCAPRPR